MMTINNQTTHFDFTSEYDSIIIKGSYILNEDKTLEGIEANIEDSSEYLGNFYVYVSDGELFVNQNSISVKKMKDVEDAIFNCINEIKSNKY